MGRLRITSSPIVPCAVACTLLTLLASLSACDSGSSIVDEVEEILRPIDNNNGDENDSQSDENTDDTENGEDNNVLRLRYVLSAGSRSVSQTLQQTELWADACLGVTLTSATDATVLCEHWPYTVSAEQLLVPDEEPYPTVPEGAYDITVQAPQARTSYSMSDVAFSVLEDQSADEDFVASDLLWGQLTNQSGNELPDVTLHHLTARINLHFEFVNGFDLNTLRGAVIKLTGLQTAFTYNPQTGTIGEPLGEPNDIIAFRVAADETDESHLQGCVRAIPQVVRAKVPILTIGLANGVQVYAGLYDNDVQLLPNHYHDFTFRISGRAAVLQATLVGYEDGGEYTGNMQENH